ncbi:MAG: SMC-Scp complex subunit ScpB [Gammaproteobacteria bacterium]
MNITPEQLQQILEAAIMVAGRPLPIAHMQRLFDEAEQPTTDEIKAALQALTERHQTSGFELREVASGYQFQAKQSLSSWLCRLWEERPPRYSRALLETLALIAYRQPITRAEIEDIRGVTVSSHITKTLLEREWIKVMGYREVAGKPALYGTTKAFLDHFNLKSLDELPTLAELRDLDQQEAKLQVQLELPQPEVQSETESTTSSTETIETETSVESEIVLIEEESQSAEYVEETTVSADEEHQVTAQEEQPEFTPTEGQSEAELSQVDENQLEGMSKETNGSPE